MKSGKAVRSNPYFVRSTRYAMQLAHRTAQTPPERRSLLLAFFAQPKYRATYGVLGRLVSTKVSRISAALPIACDGSSSPQTSNAGLP